MKKVIFIMSLVILGITNFNYSQEQIQTIDSVFVAGVENTVLPTYTNYYDGVKFYDGVAGFVFNVTNYVDTLTQVIFEGGYEGVNGAVSYVAIDTLTELVDSKTYSFSQAPPVYQKYRIRAPLISGDTATLSNIIYFEKVPKIRK